jgi:hypothetical protein
MERTTLRSDSASARAPHVSPRRNAARIGARRTSVDVYVVERHLRGAAGQQEGFALIVLHAVSGEEEDALRALQARREALQCLVKRLQTRRVQHQLRVVAKPP